MRAGRLQEGEGADHIGLHEFTRPVDRSIDMGLRGQVHHPVRSKLRETTGDCRSVTYVYLSKLVAGIILEVGQRVTIAGVGQFIDVEHFVLSSFEQVANEVAADKTAASGD